jgi:hypothetical protein
VSSWLTRKMSDPASNRIERVQHIEYEPLFPAAIQLHRLGVSLIPMHPRTKKPSVRWTPYQRECADEEQLRTWFADTDNGQLGIGIVGGQVSGGLLVRDFDRQASYDAWALRQPTLAKTLPTVISQRGAHVWFRCKGYMRDDARTFVRQLGDGELRGDAHIIVAPPSLHELSGLPYRWLVKPNGHIPEIALHDFGFTPPVGAVTHAISVLHGSAGSLASVPLPPARPPASVSECIRRTLPDGQGQRHRQIFELARWIKAIPELANLDARDLEDHVRDWYAQALPVIRTKDYAETWKDFRSAWLRIRIPAGAGSLNSASVRAMSSPLPPEVAQFKVPQIQLLVALCRELQRERGTEPFFLSCRDAAASLGLTGKNPHVTAWRYLNTLCEAGVLRKGKAGSQRDRKANEYRYLGTLQ